MKTELESYGINVDVILNEVSLFQEVLLSKKRAMCSNSVTSKQHSNEDFENNEYDINSAGQDPPEVIINQGSEGSLTIFNSTMIYYKYIKGALKKHIESSPKMIIDHVNSFPKEKNNYARAKSDKKYLSQDLNISSLFQTFHGKYLDSLISYHYFYENFKRCFSIISFHHPRTDTCGICDLL